MKKITWLTFICTALLGILLLCCTNGLSPDSSVKGDGVVVGDQLTISIHADENLEIFAKSDTNRKSRTISSEAFKLNETNPLQFYLWGKATNGQSLAPRTVEVSSTDGITGKVILDIDCYNWELTLAAVSNDFTLDSSLDEAEQINAVKADAVLIGSATVDMVFTNSIEFTLSPKGLTKLGAVALTIAREDNWAIPDDYVVTAGIYNITTGKEIEVYNSDGTLNDTGNTLQVLSDLETGETAPMSGKFVDKSYTIPTPYVESTATYTANGNKLKPGTYLFQISLKKDGENRAYVWNDTIIVLPGKTSDMINVLDSGNTHAKTKLLIIPNLIGEKPAAPTDFQVTLSDEDKDASGYYTATFTWEEQNVVTETNFALEIIELADSQEGYKTQEIGDTSWESLIANAENYYCFDYLNDLRKDPRFYKDGSLFANNEEVVVLLELGKRYLARLRSENNAGYSEDASYICIADATDSSKFYYNDINKYRVTYHLQGGTWETAPAASTTLDQIEYDTQSDTGYTVLEPKGPEGTYPYLHDGAAVWLYWTQGLNGEKYPTDTSVTPNVLEKYKGYKNLDLYAKYSREGGVTVYDDNTYDIFQDYLTGLSQDGTNTTITKSEKIEISKSKTQSDGTGKYTEVSIMLPEVPEEDKDDPTINWKYDKVIFEVTYGGRTYVADEQVGAVRGESNTFKFYLTNFQTGYVYNCKITAHYQRTVVSYPFALYLTD